MLTCAKMNSNGNDFIVINNMDKKVDSANFPKMAINYCRRREAIGADGILVAEPSDCADFKMRLFNRDGSEGEMCGNGSRCIARFAFEKGIVKTENIVFETIGGNVHAVVVKDKVTVSLAPVSLNGIVLDKPTSVKGFNFSYTFLTVGVPHVVIFEEKRSRTDDEYREIGKAIRNRLDLFPEGANINFVVPKGNLEGDLNVLTYERGVEDLTLSCGTGSTASAIASLLLGISGPKVNVWNPGGLNKVSLNFETANIILPKLEGGAVYVADFTIVDELKVK